MNEMRRWLSLFEKIEVKKQRLLHISNAELRIGTILRPSGVNLLDDDVEEPLERYRPSDRPARSASVFMALDERSLEDLTALAEPKLYRVWPAQPLIRLDHMWANLLFRMLANHEDNPVADFDKQEAYFAQGYWSGRPAPGERYDRAAWEYLAPSARVLERLW